jgi:chaperone modulatory protein CbpM
MTMSNQDPPADPPFELEAVETWIAAGWLAPPQDREDRLSAIDLARAQLIHDLTHHLGVNDEGVPIILNLIDQVHGLRRAMRELLARGARVTER